MHVLPEGFTKIRHYVLLGNNRRKRMLPLAREALKGSRCHVAMAPVKACPTRPVEENLNGRDAGLRSSCASGVW